MIGFSAASNAQATSDAATTSATIITPISISKTTDMNFGNVAVQAATAGTVLLAPGGTRTQTGGVTLPATAGTVSAAAFEVTGQANYTYSITLPTSVTISNSDTTPATMTVDTFTSTPTPTGTLSAGGAETINVGATLNVAAAQAGGTYSNTTDLTVTVNYN